MLSVAGTPQILLAVYKHYALIVLEYPATCALFAMRAVHGIGFLASLCFSLHLRTSKGGYHTVLEKIQIKAFSGGAGEILQPRGMLSLGHNPDAPGLAY